MVRGRSHSSFCSDFLGNTISKVITREIGRPGQWSAQRNYQPRWQEWRAESSSWCLEHLRHKTERICSGIMWGFGI